MSYTFLRKKNNAKTTLSGDVGAASGTMVVVSGSLFPTSGDFLCTIWDKSSYADPSDDASMEIVKVTAVAGGTSYTISRGQEATVAGSHVSGNAVELLFTVGTITELEGQINGVLEGTFTWGPSATEGSWQAVLVGSNLSFQRYESGAWVEKMSLTP